MQKTDIKLDWWKLACNKNPDAIAFLDMDDRYAFCNKSWCKLFGYSESELIKTKWQDITKSEDVGNDVDERESIKRGEKEDYYLEKTYIRKDGSEVFTKIYVHRYPETGTQEGYVVFAKKVTSEDYEDLKSKFLDLQKTVLILQQNAVASDFISGQISLIEQKLEQTKELSKMAIERGSNINIGDRLNNESNKAGGNITLNKSSFGIIILCLLGFLMLLLAAVVGLVCFIFMKGF